MAFDSANFSQLTVLKLFNNLFEMKILCSGWAICSESVAVKKCCCWENHFWPNCCRHFLPMTISCTKSFRLLQSKKGFSHEWTITSLVTVASIRFLKVLCQCQLLSETYTWLRHISRMKWSIHPCEVCRPRLACELWQSINPSLVFLRRKRLYAVQEQGKVSTNYAYKLVIPAPNPWYFNRMCVTMVGTFKLKCTMYGSLTAVCTNINVWHVWI